MSTVLRDATNEGSEKRVKSARFWSLISTAGRFAISGDDLKDDIVGESALDIGEQCEEV